MWILVHEVVVVCDFPVAWSLINCGKYVKELSPFKICFEAHHILHHVAVVVAEQDLGIVLVLHEELHGGLDEGGDGNAVGPVVGVDAVKNVALVLSRSIVGAGSTEQ